MRDPERIISILGKLEKMWLKNPDLRLGQIIVNCTRYSVSHSFTSPEVFNLEDDDLEKALELFNESPY